MTTKKEREEAIERLREWVKPGDTLHTILRHVSRSGMMRSISVKVIKENKGEPYIFNLDWNAAAVLGWKLDSRRDGIKVKGCGMDMGFHLVYSLSSALYPDGFECTGEKCPSNDHTNGDRDYTPHKHKSGGYALRQRWL